MNNLTRIDSGTPLSAINGQFSTEPDRRWTDYLRMAFRRWYFVPISSAALALLAYTVSSHQPKVFTSTAEVLVQSPATATSSNVSTSQYAEIANILGMSSGSDLSTQIEMMTTDSAMKEVAADNNYVPAPIPSDFKARFDIEPFRTSSEIVLVKASAEKPRLAANLIKSLLQVYNKTVSAQSATAIGRLTASTQAELVSIGHRLSEAENERTNYSRSINSVNIAAESDQKVTQLFALRQQLLSAQSSLAVAQAQFQFYGHQIKILDPSILPNLTFAANPRIEADKGQLEQLEQQRVLLSAQYTPADDQMINNQKQIDVIKQQMEDEREQESKNFAFSLGGTGGRITAPPGSYIVGGGTEVLNPLREDARQKYSDQQATIDADQSQIKVLTAALNALHDDVSSTPNAIRKMGDLDANVQVLRTIYTDLQAQSAQLQARLPAEQSFATILSGPIIPKKPESPKPDLMTALGAVFGALVGVLLAVLIDNGDLRLRDDKDAESLFGRPLLQSIALKKHVDPLLESGEDLEPYKELAFTLGYLGVGKSVRALLVTSSVKDEGATSVSSNLALALSREGRRVVLIDANLKMPKLHVLFGEKNSVGLIGLMRNGTQPDHALVSVSASQSLRIITGGDFSAVDGSGDLVNAEKFELILERLKDDADIVIIDSPGVFEGFETSVLADKVDGIVFVTRAGYTPRATVRRAFDLLQNCRAAIIGTVVTVAKD